MLGRIWEQRILNAFRDIGGCTVIKTAVPVRVVRFTAEKTKRRSGEFIGYFEGKGPCDFEGGWGSLFLSMEAKETKGTSIHWPVMIPEHQQRRMHAVHMASGAAGLLLSFRNGEVGYGVAWWRFMLAAANSRSISESWCSKEAALGIGVVLLTRANDYRISVPALAAFVDVCLSGDAAHG